MQINLDNYLIDIIIEYKSNKNIYIRVKDDLKMYVTCNKRVSKNDIIKLIEDNKKSLIKMYEKKLTSNEHNSYYYYLGNKCVVVYDSSIKKTYLDDNIIYTKDEKSLDKFYKEQCIEVFTSEIERIKPKFPNIPEFRLRIRKMTTRWGVCNRKDNIVTLNSELIKKDITLLDYVIVHELSHFYEGNHSSSFWNEVSKRYPNYKEARRELNKY